MFKRMVKAIKTYFSSGGIHGYEPPVKPIESSGYSGEAILTPNTESIICDMPAESVVCAKHTNKARKKKKRVKKIISPVIKKEPVKIVAQKLEEQVPIDWDNPPILDVNDLSRFVASLPGSNIPGTSLISKYFYQDPKLDKRVAGILEIEEALYIFLKYNMTTRDRKRLIAAIINVKLLEQ